ncbi:MAG: hypothetical protein MOGMAGMI_01686 [Candidatus Omnitrophica bacterium]|nr:hypothetical protein [Candidatus Omnitrophota bacterium]
MTSPNMPAATASPFKYSKEDFVSGQEVRWCPGCGDYSILSVMQKTLAEHTTIPREQHVFVSGIGCSSRFPYYMRTYGFHTVHGRAPSIATGLKCARPDLKVWVVTGDGDGLSIGGNHLIHCLRRNVDINIILVNNQIYGLTKGQYSPTSEKGKVTKSTPDGSIDYPINPLCIAIAAEATFIARTVDSDPRHMGQVFTQAMRHKGVSFIEVLQNCVIFNKDTHLPIVGRENREDRAIYLEHGKPLIFGKNKDKGIRLSGSRAEIVDLAAHPEAAESLVKHDMSDPEPNWAYQLSQMTFPEFPVPFGVFRDIERPTYDEMMNEQTRLSIEKRGKGDLKKLLYNEEVWVINPEKEPVYVASKDKKRPAEPPKTHWHADEEELLLKSGAKQPKDKLRKLLMNEKLTDFISKVPPIIVGPETPVQEAVERLWSQPKKGCVLVCEPDGKLLGIVTIRDFLWRAAGKIEDLRKTPIRSIMTPRPECLDKNASLSFALHKMAINRIRHVPVLDGGKAVGVVSSRDIIEYLEPK